MRIIAGMYRGRRLRVPASGTRPTTDRVREALFNVLGAGVQGSQVLDCYAGSGALGIEALSRGASRVVFVEKARAAVEVVRANLLALGLTDPSRAQVLQKPLEKSAAALCLMGPFDLWLVDPPFALVRDGTAAAVLSGLVDARLLTPSGTVVLEYPSDQPCPVIRGLHPNDIRPYGDSHLALYELAAGDDRSKILG